MRTFTLKITWLKSLLHCGFPKNQAVYPKGHVEKRMTILKHPLTVKRNRLVLVKTQSSKTLAQASQGG